MKIHNIIDLGIFVNKIAQMTEFRNPYITLGAEGIDFFAEVCTGQLDKRTIHKNIIIYMVSNEGISVELSDTEHKEIIVNLPDAKHLIAFVALLIAAFKAEIKVLHPLTEMGNYLPDWQDALVAATS